jgi:hypothetical protein
MELGQLGLCLKQLVVTEHFLCYESMTSD